MILWYLEELGRNVDYVTIRNRALAKYIANIELTKDDRKNNIRVTVSIINYLLLDDGTHKHVCSSRAYNKGFKLPFYIGNTDMIKEIFVKFEALSKELNIQNEDKCLETIEQFTKCKRADLAFD